MLGIYLDDVELEQESAAMRQLSGEYRELFSGITSVLHDCNQNWSPNLSHNISGKVDSIQNGLNTIVDLLTDGASKADMGVKIFRERDNRLSAVFQQKIRDAKQPGGVLDIADMHWSGAKIFKKTYGMIEDVYAAVTGIYGNLNELDSLPGLKTIGTLAKVEKLFTEDIGSREWNKALLELETEGISINGLSNTEAGLVIDCGISMLHNTVENTMEAKAYVEELLSNPDADVVDVVKTMSLVGSSAVALPLETAFDVVGDRADDIGDIFSAMGVDINGYIEQKSNGNIENVSGVYREFGNAVVNDVRTLGLGDTLKIYGESFVESIGESCARWGNQFRKVFH